MTNTGAAVAFFASAAHFFLQKKRKKIQKVLDFFAILSYNLPVPIRDTTNTEPQTKHTNMTKYNAEKLAACVKTIITEFFQTGDTCCKWIYISTDEAYSIRNAYQANDDTQETIDISPYLERAFADIPELAMIKEARANEWMSGNVEETIASLQAKIASRYDGNAEWVIDDMVDTISADLVDAQEEFIAQI